MRILQMKKQPMHPSRQRILLKKPRIRRRMPRNRPKKYDFAELAGLRRWNKCATIKTAVMEMRR